MLKELKLLACKYNFAFPYYLGYRYNKYVKNRIDKNYSHFDNRPELLSITKQAIQNTKFYHDKYSSLNIDSLDDFESKIEFIDKDIVMNNWDHFISNKNTTAYSHKFITGTTGGTSGNPLKLALPKNRYVFEMATMHKIWSQSNWNGQIRGVIRNNRFDKSRDFEVNILKKEILFDGFRSDDEYYFLIYKTLNKYNIQYIHAYPSSAYQFASFLIRKKLDTSFIKYFLCGSEGLLPEQKELIVNRLGINILHWYGHSEKLVLGGYCKNSDMIHIEPTYGYFELIDENNHAIQESGEIGEIAGTTLHNRIMPLIRYKTGDYAEYHGNYCPHCKRHLPLLKKIYGRWDKNKIYRKDGTYITTTALNLHSDLYNYIHGIQYIQDIKGHLKVLLIKGEKYDENIHNKFIDHFNQRFESPNTVDIQYVTNLKKQANGKFLNLISTIKI